MSEAVIAVSATGVRLIGEYRDGTPEPLGNGIVHIPRIYIAIRLEAVVNRVRPVKSYQAIEADPHADVSKEVAYYVRGGLRQGGREFVVDLDLRTATTARLIIPLARQAFFTDAAWFLGSSRFVANADLGRKPQPIPIVIGERKQPSRQTRA